MKTTSRPAASKALTAILIIRSRSHAAEMMLRRAEELPALPSIDAEFLADFRSKLTTLHRLIGETLKKEATQ